MAEPLVAIRNLKLEAGTARGRAAILRGMNVGKVAGAVAFRGGSLLSQ